MTRNCSQGVSTSRFVDFNRDFDRGELDESDPTTHSWRMPTRAATSSSYTAMGTAGAVPSDVPRRRRCCSEAPTTGAP